MNKSNAVEFNQFSDFFPDTSLTEWKTSNNLDPAEPLDSYHQALFFEDIQIAEYLLLEPCTLLEDTWDASG